MVGVVEADTAAAAEEAIATDQDRGIAEEDPDPDLDPGPDLDLGTAEGEDHREIARVVLEANLDPPRMAPKVLKMAPRAPKNVLEVQKSALAARKKDPRVRKKDPRAEAVLGPEAPRQIIAPPLEADPDLVQTLADHDANHDDDPFEARGALSSFFVWLACLGGA